jgi:hypothetical protein
MLIMNEKMIELMERRDKLLARVATQREELADIGTQLHGPLSLADKGVAVARFLRFHPLLIAGVAALFLFRRRNVADLIWVGWSAWKVLRDLTSISAKLISRN